MWGLRLKYPEWLNLLRNVLFFDPLASVIIIHRHCFMTINPSFVHLKI